MSKPSESKNRNRSQTGRTSENFAEETTWQPSMDIAKTALDALASLRLTVALLAMSVFIVLAGTLGQVHRDIWEVIHDYFRMNLSEEFSVLFSFSVGDGLYVIPTPVTWIDLKIFFPPSFSQGHVPPDLSRMFAPARWLSSLLLGVLWSSLVWLIPMRDKKLQLGIFATCAATMFLLCAKMGGFWFPKGWTIGALMAVNLLLAHLIRFKVQSKGNRLLAGVGVIALGVLATLGVIMSGSNKDGVLKENLLGGMELEWSTIWIWFECGLAALVVLGGYVYFSLWRRTLRENPDIQGDEMAFDVLADVFLPLLLIRPMLYETARSSTVTMRRVTCVISLLMAGVLIFLVQGGSETQLNDSGMRILWQLLKATVAGLILLAGCVLVFRKRAGVVVLHSGVALIMLSELLVGVAAVESQMQIVEGQSSNFVKDIREIEIAVTDPNQPDEDHVVVIPTRFIKEGNLIQDERLPVNIQVDKFYPHSELQQLGPVQPNAATHGFGKSVKDITIVLDNFFRGKARGEDFPVGVVEVQGSTGTDNASDVDQASAYVTLFSKTEDGENDRKLGTLLLSQHFVDYVGNFQAIPQQFTVEDEPYYFSLRYKRIYKPYTITLKSAHQKNYVGTSTPRDYRSIIDLKDPTRNEDRENVHIWMNNPLRFAGETFYQSGLSPLPGGKNMTTLQVVTNDGWMIPYVACMIVAVGMLAHFLITLLRFLNRDSRIGSKPVSSTAKNSDSNIEVVEAGAPLMAKAPERAVPVDPLQRSVKWPWLTPVLSVGLVLVFGGYLASKARTPNPSEEGIDFYEAGQIPVAYQGRVKPMDTLARNSLRILSNRQEFTDGEGNKQPAMRWLMDLIVNEKESNKHRMYRIDYHPVLDALGLSKRKGYLYSYDEIMKDQKQFGEQVQNAAQVKDPKSRSMYQKKFLELAKKIRLRNSLVAAFDIQTVEGPTAVTDLINATLTTKRYDRAVVEDGTELPLVNFQPTDKWEVYYKISLWNEIAQIAEKHETKDVRTLAEKMIEDFDQGLAARLIGRERRRIKQEARKQNQAVSETATQFAQKATDNNLREAYEKIAEARPIDDDLTIASRLSEPVLNYFAFNEGIVYLLEEFPEDVTNQVRRDSPARIAESPDDDPRSRMRLMLSMALEEVLKAGLDGKTVGELNPDAPLKEVFAAYKKAGKNGADKADVEAFNDAVAKYQASVAEAPPTDHEKPISPSKLRFESFFNNAAPFYYLAAIYLIAGILAAISWLTCFQPLNRATFWLLLFCLVVHTAALVGRIYISGRPPVTNLYSSAVFIGWGCVLLGLLFEWFFDIGIGNLVAAVAGFMTLGVAHLLTTEVASFRGDSFTVMQAVLDTQFWLATHVVCISMGYAATFVAGFLGIAYIVGGVFTPLLSEPRRKDLLRMVYGTLCFAIFFSFVGTVLGGLWADDSWGRFWGWDTKENGALIIVLWNALVLHARWGGIVKDRGLAAFAVAGNIAVSWSWFGVNELGIGLHSYGFTEGVLPVLALFAISQLMLVGIGCVPKAYWWSHIAEQEKSTA